MNIKTSSTHKGVTEGGKKKHDTHVKSLKETLKSYNTNPFDNEPVKVLTTGVEAEINMVNGLLEALNIGNKRFLEFVNNCFIKKTRSMFLPITKLNLESGIKKRKRKARAVEILKEDVQAFLVGKSVSLDEALRYPITSVSLSLAYPDGHLRQGNKSNLRNVIIKDSTESLSEYPA